MSNLNTKIKILHLIESLACGGAERMLIGHLSYLNRDKFYNVVSYLYDEEYFLPEILKMGIKAYPIHLKNIYQPFRAMKSLISIIKKEKIDIVHTHLFGASIYGRIAGKLANARGILTTIHNPDYELQFVFRNRLFFERRRLLDRFTGNFLNNTFIAVSKAVKETVEKSLGFKNIVVIYNSIDVEELKPLNEEERIYVKSNLGIKKNSAVIVIVGRLEEQKGHIFLLEALSQVELKNKDLTLFVLGQGPLEGSLKKIVKYFNIQDKVIFLGNRKDIRQIVGCADMFVLPSIFEGFGIVLLEGMALKIPCIASDVGGVSEIITNNENGLLVKPASSKALAEAILALMDNPVKRREFAENGYKKVVEDFNIKNNIKLLENVYTSVYSRQY